MLLAFEDDVGLALKRAFETDHDDDAAHLSKCAQIIRKDIFDTKYNFDGSFKKGTGLPEI